MLSEQKHQCTDGNNGSKSHATALLKNGLVDYLASDAHRVEHYATYLKALKEAQKY